MGKTGEKDVWYSSSLGRSKKLKIVKISYMNCSIK